MYFGETATKLDDKGRVTVPRKMRDKMAAHGHAVWFMTRGFDGSIFLFHKEEWDKLRQQAGRRSSMDAKALDFRRLFFSSVTEVQPDGQGRMSVAPHLREYAGLDKEAVLIGVDDHLELWDRDRWRGFQADREAEYKEMASPVFEQRDEATTEQRIGERE